MAAGHADSGFNLGSDLYKLSVKKADRDIKTSDLRKKVERQEKGLKEIVLEIDKKYQQDIADIRSKLPKDPDSLAIQEELLRGVTADYEEFKQQFAEYLQK